MRDWFVTRKAASSSSPAPTEFRRALSSPCSSIVKGGSGSRPFRTALLALTIRGRDAGLSYRTLSTKGLRVTGWGALLKTVGDAFTLDPITVWKGRIRRPDASGISQPGTDWPIIKLLAAFVTVEGRSGSAPTQGFRDLFRS